MDTSVMRSKPGENKRFFRFSIASDHSSPKLELLQLSGMNCLLLIESREEYVNNQWLD